MRSGSGRGWDDCYLPAAAIAQSRHCTVYRPLSSFRSAVPLLQRYGQYRFAASFPSARRPASIAGQLPKSFRTIQ